MSEHRTRAEVAERSGGLCELGFGRAEEMSHRLSEGRGGLWTPWNVVHLSSFGHRWAHANPAKAYAAGIFVETGAAPEDVPVWLARPWPSWWRIRPARSGPHYLEPLDHLDAGLPAVPELPRRAAA